MRIVQNLSLLLFALTLSACTTLERPEPDYPTTSDFQPSGFVHARFAPYDQGIAARLEKDLRDNLSRHGATNFNILALSGGGADGAFGAGVLLGWTERGDRPEFRVVTGVSTGALIAPFAFLGTDYDDELKDAYTSGVADDLGKSRGIMGLFTPGVLSTNRLSALVERYVDTPMVVAIAKEHAKGRRLVVATTNLDSQTGVVWDIGAIAEEAVKSGDPARLEVARDLIRQVLTASASVPAAFAPVMINTQRPINGGSQTFTEMHVDGSVTLPFFVLPESLLNWQLPPELFTGGHIYVLINGKIRPQAAITPYNSIHIVSRSLDTMAKAQARTNLQALQGFADRNGIDMGVVSLPDEFIEGGLLAFDAVSMRRVFYYGFQLGASKRLWQPDTPPAPEKEP